MNKGQVIGLVVTGLAVIGGVAVYNWVRKPKKNSEGFFNASGKAGKSGKAMFPGRCNRCRDVEGNIYVPSRGSNCLPGEICLS
jgi:hypothetical protein